MIAGWMLNWRPESTRRARLWTAAQSRGIPLRAILATVGVVVAVYASAKLLYRLRDVLLLIVVAGFIALILNPLVVQLQRLGIRRRGGSVAVVTLLAVLVFIGLAAAFGYPLANGVTHLAHAAAVVRERRGARPGPDRAPGAQVSRPGLGAAAMPPSWRASGRGSPSLPSAWARAPSRWCWRWPPSSCSCCSCCWRAPRCGRGLLDLMSRGAGGALFADSTRRQPVGQRVHAGQRADIAHRRDRRAGDAAVAGGAVPVPVGAVGGAGRLPADGRRRAGGHSDRAVRGRPLAHG